MRVRPIGPHTHFLSHFTIRNRPVNRWVPGSSPCRGVAPAGVARMDVIDVQASVDVLHAAVDKSPTEEVLVVEHHP